MPRQATNTPTEICTAIITGMPTINLACLVLCRILRMVASIAADPPSAHTSKSVCSGTRQAPRRAARLSYRVSMTAKPLTAASQTAMNSRILSELLKGLRVSITGLHEHIVFAPDVLVVHALPLREGILLHRNGNVLVRFAHGLVDHGGNLFGGLLQLCFGRSADGFDDDMRHDVLSFIIAQQAAHL